MTSSVAPRQTRIAQPYAFLARAAETRGSWHPDHGPDHLFGSQKARIPTCSHLPAGAAGQFVVVTLYVADSQLAHERQAGRRGEMRRRVPRTGPIEFQNHSLVKA